VKLFQQTPSLLGIAVTISVLAHLALLAVRFAPPEAFRFQPADPGLEVILVNARHDRKPLKAEALAQANLDGGGIDDGDSAAATRRRIAELEEAQRKLMDSMKAGSRFLTPLDQSPDRPNAPPQPDGADAVENTRALARREAEIAKNIEDYNKRPKKTQITPSTREVGYAAYYRALQDRIEKIGTLNFPQKDGKKLYGELVLYIPVFQDGSIYEKDGGPRVERSSGNPALDREAIRIVRRSAPFGGFPDKMRSTGKDDVWEVITRFRFTREDALEAVMNGVSNGQ
jgi:protein TonB